MFGIDLNYNTSPSTKALGVLWSAQEGAFSCIMTSMLADILSKRFIVGRVAEVFDSLGLARPFKVRAKILVQDLWTKGLGWDEPFTQEIGIWAKEWFLELEDLKELKLLKFKVAWETVNWVLFCLKQFLWSSELPEIMTRPGPLRCLNHCAQDESCPFKPYHCTMTGIDCSNWFEPNVVNYSSPKDSDRFQ